MASTFIDRSPSGFTDALCKRIEKALASFWQEGERDDYHEPHVHAQFLPVSKTESQERDETKDCPFVQTVITGGEIFDFHEVANGSVINISIYFTGHSDDTDNQGWRIPASMMWRVLQDFLSNTLIEGYQFEAPCKWTVLNTREPPYYTAQLDTRWRGAPPSFEVPVGIFIDTGNNQEETHEVKV